MLAAEKIIIPTVVEDDVDDVRDALEIASSLWRTGDDQEALKWLGRAAKAADDGGQAARAAALLQAAAELPSPRLPAPTEPMLHPEAEYSEEPSWKIGSHQRKVIKTGMRPAPPPPFLAEPESVASLAGDTLAVALAPDAQVSEVPISEVPISEVPVSEVPAPQVPAPQVPAPQVPAPQVPAPQVPAPQLAAPQLPVAEALALDEVTPDASATGLTGLTQKMQPANDGGGSPSLVALSELYERTGRWAERTAPLEAIAADGHLDLAELEVLAPDAFELLEDLHRAGSRWETIIEQCFNRIEAAVGAAEQTALLRLVAQVLGDELLDTEQAFEVLVTAFELDLSDDRTVRALENVTAATKRWPELVGRVNGWLEQTADPRLQLALSLRLSKWYAEDLDRPDYAEALYARVVQLDPTNVRALRQMAKALRKQGEWRKAGMLLEQAQRHATKDSDRGVVFTELGDLLQKVDGQNEKRLAYYQRALEADDCCVAALTALAAIYDEKDMTAELVAVLDRKAAALSSTAPAHEAAAVRLRQAGLLELLLSKPAAAAQAYRQALDSDPANVLAMRGLERVYRSERDWIALGGVLEMHLDVADSERERSELSMQIALLQDKHFLRPDLAARRLELVVEIDPTSAAAFAALSACYRKMRQFRDVIDCLQRSVRAAAGKDDKIAIHTEIAQIYEDELQDQDQAISAYRCVVDLDRDHVPTLEAMAKLFARMGKSADAVECMAQVAALADDLEQRVEAYHAIGKQLAGQLDDRARARDAFQQALDLDPAHRPTLAALRALALEEGDLHLAARLLDSEQDHTEAAPKRARLLTQLGHIRERLQQPVEALEAYQLARQADADNLEAALCLARLFLADGAAERAEPLTDLLTRSRTRDQGEKQVEIDLLHAKVKMAVGKPAEAQPAFVSVRRLDMTNVEAIWGLAEACFQLGEWSQSLSQFHNALATLSEQDTTERAEIYFKIGRIKQAQQRPKAAIEHLDRSLELDDSRRDAREALAEIYEQRGDWDQACALRHEVLDRVADPRERSVLLRALAAIYDDEMDQPLSALDLYEEAAALQPGDHALLHLILPLYHETQQWARMVEALRQITTTDPKPQRRARYLFTMAQIHRDKLCDAQQAVALFEEALDLDSACRDAFARIEKIHSEQENYQLLEQAYRKMIHRIAGKGQRELERSLWRRLGLVYWDELDDLDKAAEALRVAITLADDPTEERLLVIELAEQLGQNDEALDQYRAIIAADPSYAGAYSGMYTHYLEQGAYDEAWCCAAALSSLGQADEAQQRFYEDWRPSAAPRVSGRLDEAQWSKHLLQQSDEDRKIGRIFEAVAGAAVAARLEMMGAAGQLPLVAPQERQEPHSSTVGLARALWWAAEVLSVAAPQLYMRSTQPGGLTSIPASLPSSLAGRDVCTRLDPLEQLFVVGQHLAMNRPEHIIKGLFQTKSELTVILYAAIGLIAPQAPVPQQLAEQVRVTAQALARFIQPRQREQLKYAVKDFLAAGGRGNIKRWARTVATTAARAGLLLSGDLTLAEKILSRQPQIPGELSLAERLDDLRVWFVSDSYFQLRKRLGIAVQL